MAYNLGETIQQMHQTGELDKLVHYFILSGNMQWERPYLDWANGLLSRRQWLVAGEYIPLDETRAPSDYSFTLDQPTRAYDCRFEAIHYDNLPAIIITAQLEGIGPTALLDYRALVTDQGVPFEHLYQAEVGRLTA